MNRSFCMLMVLTVLFIPATLRTSRAELSQPQEVRVNNFPETQQIRGSVSIEGPLSHAKFFKREGILVPPSRRNELSELVHAGVIDTDGYTSVQINMQGEVRSDTFSTGKAGVLLVPDEGPVLRSLREAKRVQFPLEAFALLKSGESSFFESEPSVQRVAFPRYRIYLYNTSNKSTDMSVYLYLTN